VAAEISWSGFVFCWKNGRTDPQAHKLKKEVCMKGEFRLLVVFLSVLLLSACGSVPTVKDSRYYDAGGEKVGAFDFVYYKSKMSGAKSIGAASPYQKSTSGLDDIRYESFGDDLVKVASMVFSDYGIALLGARDSDSKLDLEAFRRGSDEVTVAGERTLYLYASSGKVTTNQHMVRANFVFDAILLDRVQRKVKWQASIDTSAWAGRDFVMKSADATVYDEAYATQLLKVVADKMKSDGVI
jgi:hypothetical protein